MVSGERFRRSAILSSVRKWPEHRRRIVSTIRVRDTFFRPNNRSPTRACNAKCSELSGKCTELGTKCTELGTKCTELGTKCTELSGKCTELPVICSGRTPSRVWTVASDSGNPGLGNVYTIARVAPADWRNPRVTRSFNAFGGSDDGGAVRVG